MKFSHSKVLPYWIARNFQKVKFQKYVARWYGFKIKIVKIQARNIFEAQSSLVTISNSTYYHWNGAVDTAVSGSKLETIPGYGGDNCW